MSNKRNLFAAIVIAGVSIGCGGETVESDAGEPAMDSGALADAGSATDAGETDASLDDAGEDAMVAIL